MATSDEWSRVGFTGNPVTGNPGVLDNITKELRGLSDLAGRVDSGLDALLTKAEDGGFEGRTADALRTYVKDELKTFMANVNRSFDMAANATARYARALGDSQDRAENAADTVAALERVGGQPLPENDPELTRARGEVDAETDAIQAEAKILEEALREAARLVSRPVKKPKKSFWKRFVSTFFKVLEIVALVITLVAAIIGGPLGLVAFGLGAVLFAKALVDYATGNGNALSLGLAFLGILFPSTKGLTTLGGLARMASAGTKALGGALSASGRLLFRGGRMLFASPGRLLSLAGQGLVRFGGGLGSRAAGGFMALPRVLSKTPAMLGSALRFMGGFARSTFRQGWSALSRDFVESTAFIGGNTAGRLGVFTALSLGRLTMTALLPMRYSEIARFGYRGAFRMGFIDRGLHFAPRTVPALGRTGSLAGDLTNLTGRNLDRGGSLRPVTGTDTDRLAVPGTPEFNDTLDELAEISVTPVTTPRTPAFSSLTGSGTPRMPGRLDDLGGRLTTLDTLDTVGLPVGTFPGGQRLGTLNPVTGRVGDDLIPPRLGTTLTLFDQVDEFGAPLTPGSPTTLLPPRSTVDELRDLDELTGMERTGAGLLKPLDELADLAELSLDGRLGGLTEFQVSKILDGEIDLVNVAPDGVVLRIGKTDPVDVRVRLKDGVKVDVLGPSDPRVPTWNTTTGADRLDELGIKLDDLTRLIPDTTDGSRAARDLLGLGPVRTDLTSPVAKSSTFTPLTLRDIVTGGATGKLATERFQAWVRTQSTQLQLDTAGRRLGELDELTDLPPLSRAQAQLDLSAARLDFDRSRIAFDRLGMNLDIVNRDITVMMTRVDGPAGTMPTGELRLMDDLGRPTGQWITMEPGPTVTWVLKSDAGIVPDVKVRMVDGVFTVTTPEGVVTRFGADGRPTVLGDPGSVTLPRLPGTGLDEVVLPAPRQPDRLAFAADRSVDIQTITPAPVWRATDETLWRIGGKRPLDQIFSEGFTVRDPLETSLDVMVRTGQPSAFVSTTTDQNLIWDGIFKFEIEASGGIDVGRTFERSMGTDAWRTSGWATESEIAFPGGIASEFIRGAYRMDAQQNLLEWIPNPNFGGNNPLPELAVDLKGAGEGTSGISALDFQGLSLDDQLRLLDQLDLGETRAFDDIGSPNGSNALDEVGSQLDDLGYLSDEFQFDRFDAPAPRAQTVLVDPQEFAGVTGFRTEWQRTPLDEGGSMVTGRAGDIRLVFDAGEVLRFSDVRIPTGDGFVRFDADAGPGSMPRIVGQDGVPLPGGATIEPVRGALGVVTGVRVQSPDGAWIGRFDLDGTRLSEQLTLSGPVGGPLTGSRLTTTFTQLPGGAQSATYRLTVPGLGDGAFDVVRLDGDLAQRLPGGLSVTDTATGGRFVLDRGGRFVDLPAEGATPIRLDVSGSTVPDTSAGPLTTLDDLGEVGDLARLGDLGEAGDLARLGDLGDLGELGTVNRLAPPDLPRTNLMPEPSGLDARFGASVTDGAPTPVNPARFDGMRLSGADELTDLRLRVTEFPATDLAPASFRIDVLDFGAPGGPVRLENVTVTLREGGGLSITGPQGGVRRQFDGLGQLEYRDLPLTGTDLALRFTDDAVHPLPRVVGPDGVPVQGATLTPLRDATGALSELTVRVPVPDTGGLTAVWRFEPGGTLRQQELPLTLPGIDGPAGLGVKVTIAPGPGGTMTRVLELTGPSNLTGSFRLGPMDGSLAGRLPNGFTVTDTVTGARFHFDADGRLAIRDIPARDGSGFLRFTEDAAPGTPPVRLDELGDLGDFAGDLGDVARIFDRTLDEAGGVRGPLDDLNRLTGPDAPRTDALPALDDFAPGERELFDDLWNNVVQDVRTLTPEELNRVWGPDSPRTDTLSELGDLSDTELADLQARLDNVRRMDDGPLSADEPLRVPLSGVDELADFDLRVTRLPATEEAPQGSYRLDLTDRTPGGTGPVRASDFTVELLDDSGRFAVIDPTGTTRFTLGPDGRFLGRETLLTADGLPEGIRLNVTVVPGADATGRIAVDLLVPSGAAGSVRFTPTTGTLAARLPGGSTLTDTITGSRFHFDHTGRLALRDLPDPDGSGFLRFTEGAGPDTPPVRLDELGELGDFGGDLGERFPLGSIPENDVLDDALDTIDLAHVFDRTLDEASGIRTVPDGAQVDLSGVAGAMDFLRATPDSHAAQALDLTGLQRLADDATASLDRFGLRPELLNDQLRQMTGQARQTLRQHAVTTLGDYLDLPPAARLDDLQSVAQGAGGRVLGDFTVTPTPHGGPGGSRYTVHHNPSDITLGFGPNRELRYQEVFLRGGPEDLDGLKIGVTGRSADGGPWTPDSLDFVGTRTADGFTLTPGTEPRGGLTLTDAAGTTSWHYGPEGVHTLTDVKLPGDRGVLRFDADAPGGVPQVLDSAGHQLPGTRVELLDDGRIALVPTGKGAHPLERTVFDPAGTLLEETIAVRGKGSTLTGDFWKIDHVSGTAVRTDAAGTPFTGRFATAAVERSGTGQFRLTGADPGKVALFERETLRNGNVLHLSRDRFGQARWTEFDSPGNTFRHGERIGDADMRTFHDVPSGSWRRLIDNSGDVRTYTKGIDGGLVRAEKGADGHWTWQRFDKAGAESLSGTRHWSWDHVGFKDTYLDPATGAETVAGRRGRTWPFSGEHGSRMYVEHSVVPGHAPAGGRIDPDTYTGFGGANVQLESLETLADGGSLLVKRYADMRPPAFLWKSAAGRSPFDGFFRDLFAGDSLHRVSFWTQTAADGTKVTGVRLNPTGAHWVDIDQYGRIVRETRKLDNGNLIEVGRSLDDPKQWAPLPEYRKGGSYELSWRDTKSGTTGTRHIDGYGRWRDLFTDDLGVERVRLRSEGGGGTREYLFEAPSTRDLAVNDNVGTWVDRNSLMHITGRRDLIDGRIVESSGSPYRTSWTWRAYSPEDPTTVVAEGVRKQNRGSFYSKTWDDSFVDLDGLGNPIRERNATDVGSSWVDAVKQSGGDWKWTKTTADGTVRPGGTRVYDDIAGGAHWRDLVDGQVVRQREGGRVREFDYEIVTPQPPVLTTRVSLRDLLAQAARQFEPPTTVRVDPDVWKEFDVGKVFRERVTVDGTPGRYREVDKQWGQWREFQDGHLVAQRTFTGRVWKTDAFGRWSTSGPAMIPEYLAGALPRMGDEVGLAGDRGWTLIGRETDFRGWDIEAMGLLREVQDPWHGVFTGVRDGVSAEMPVWQRELRAALTSFGTGFVTDFTAALAVTAATNDGKLKVEDVYKALLAGSVGGTFSGGLNILYNRTPLGYYKMSMGARDWGGHPKQSMATNTDDWATEWAAQEKPTRWRNATYANTVGITTSALSGFVSNAISASIFGVNGNEVKGADALLAGLWGAGSFAFSGVTTGLARNAFHLTTGGRLFHKGGLPELGVNWTESFLARYINYWITQEGGTNLSTPNRSFPAPPTTTPAEQPQPTPDPAASSLSDGLEFP